jgi:hypothetical protein
VRLAKPEFAGGNVTDRLFVRNLQYRPLLAAQVTPLVGPLSELDREEPGCFQWIEEHS